MRVLVLTNMFPSRTPGYGVFVQDQVDDLRSLGIGVDVIFLDGAKSRFAYARGAARLHRALEEGAFDLVHAHYGLTGAIALTQRRLPVVTTFHGSDASGHIRWQQAVSRLVARRTTPVFVSTQLAEAVGLPDAVVIPAAVDLDTFQPRDGIAARRLLGWDEQAPYALFPASRAVRSKRADLFDAAIDAAREFVPNLLSASLEGVSRSQVALAMNAADVTVMTSDYEGSPVVVKESLACLTPVVSVRVGDNDMLLQGLPGCAVTERDPARIAEAVVAALDRPPEPRLRERVVPFGRRELAHRIVALYEAVAIRRPRAEVVDAAE